MVLIVEMALFPARFFAENMGGLPGGLGQGVFSLVSCGFCRRLVALFDQSVWLVAFRRTRGASAGRVGFGIISGVHRRRRSGADFQCWRRSLAGADYWSIGRVSGMMGAAARFAFPETAGLTGKLQHSSAVSCQSWVPKRRPRNDVYRRMGRH